MKKNLLEIYALAVCFVTIISGTIFLGIGIYDFIELSSPDFTIESYDYEKHQTNENFSRNWSDKRIDNTTEEQITKLRENSYQVVLKKEQREAVQSLIEILIVLIISIILFLIHWLIAKKARVSHVVTE